MDDLGTAYDGPRPARRVVSLVPSLTETLAEVDRAALVGATDWCTHPVDLDDTLVARVRGTKNPDLAVVRALRPDVVVVNREENRELDVRRLRGSGVRVWVTDIRSVPQAVTSIERLLDALGWPRPGWLAEVRRTGCGTPPRVTRRVAMAVWRDPWMVVGGATFTGDLLRRLGWQNVYAESPAGRYPTVPLAELDDQGADVVLLPDEPYRFTATDGPKAFTRTPTELVSGRALTWYGPSLAAALAGDTRSALTGPDRPSPAPQARLAGHRSPGRSP